MRYLYNNKMMMNNLFPIKVVLPALLLCMIMGLVSCSNKEENENKEKPSTAVAPSQEAFVLDKTAFTSSAHIPGELLAFQQVDLYAKVSSFIKKLTVDVGTEVRAGQVLAILDAPEISSQLQGAQSRLKSQEAIYLSDKATYDRLQETSKTPGTISANDLEMAYAKQKSSQAQLESAKAAYKEITDNKNYLQITAPFDGVITSRNVSAGAYVGPSGKGSDLPIFTLQEQKKLRLIVSIPEAYTAYLNKDTEVEFTVGSIAGKKFKARISRQAGALDNKLRSEHIEMDVQNEDKKLLPGQVAEVSIPLKANMSAFTVPSSAILNSTTGVFVIKIKDNKTIWIPVKSGRTNDGKTEVSGTLTYGDTLIVHASEEVRNGAILSGGLKIK